MDISLEELEQALVDAETAGDIDAANAIAADIEAIVQQELAKPRTAEEIATAPKSFWEKLTAPNPPEPFEPIEAAKRVGLATAEGAGLGALSFTPTGVGIGAASGFASGVAGEFARMQGAGDLQRGAIEATAGLGTEIIPMAARSGLKIVLPLSTKAGGARATAYESSSGLVSGKIEDLSTRQTQVKLFGKPSLSTQMDNKNFLSTQAELRQKYLGEDAFNPSVIPEGYTVSSKLRQDLYDQLKKTQGTITTQRKIPATYDEFRIQKTPEKIITEKKPNVFYNSPEYKELLVEIGNLAKRPEKAPGRDRANLIQIIKNETDSSVPKEAAVDDLINLIQNGGAFEKGKIGQESNIVTLITPDMQATLREKFNKYLNRTLGEEKYNILKNVERQEFIAKAKDEIPFLLNSNWRRGTEEYKRAILTASSDPATKALYAKAYLQHLSNPKFDSTQKLIAEHKALGKTLIDAKIITPKQEADILQSINKFDKTKSSKMTTNTILSLISTPLIGAISAESAKLGVDAYNNVVTDVFNM